MIDAADIVDAQHLDIRRAQRRLSIRAVETTRAALRRVDRDLRRARPGSWTEASARATLVQLRLGLMSLALAHQQDLSAGLPPVMRAAQQRTADYLRTLDSKYLGAARPLRFDTLEWWEGQSAELGRVRLRQYGRSFARYGAESVLAVEQAISAATLTGQRWEVARREVFRATAHVVNGRQWMVDRILRTEVAAAYNGTTLAALLTEDEPEAPMLKKLVATFDQVTGADSVAVHGQVRRVGEPFRDPKGRLYQAPPNRPHDREIVVGWRASWGESLPGFDQRTAGFAPAADRAQGLAAAASELPAAPPVKISRPPLPPRSARSDFPPEKVLSQPRIGPRQASPKPSQERARLAGLTARRLVVAAALRAALGETKAAPTIPLVGQRVEQLKAEYVDLRVQQAIAATSVRVAEGDVTGRGIKPGTYLDFGGMVFQVSRVDADGIIIRTPYGPARLPHQVPAVVLRERPSKVVRPRSQADVEALLLHVRSRDPRVPSAGKVSA